MVESDDIDAFLQILPCDLRGNLLLGSKREKLIEVVLDLGRLPEARYVGRSGGRILRDIEKEKVLRLSRLPYYSPSCNLFVLTFSGAYKKDMQAVIDNDPIMPISQVSVGDLEHVQSALGDFGGDNRAGIEGTLHRISAIRSRSGVVVGLTCRVGRTVRGYASMVNDLLQFGESILFVGRPGVGKTTVMREISRVLSDEFQKRVVIIDTSNEIGGVGDVPHPSIGGARRLQVPEPSMQHRVMIEAVENHMPQVIIVDEIGTEAEVQACRSIAERGVMLIGTAHGEQLENIIKNPTLSDLIGGVESVTLGDQEARTRNCNKSILERKSHPTFPFLIEMRERHYWIAHRTERSVDVSLKGKKPLVEVRRQDGKSKVVIERWRTEK